MKLRLKLLTGRSGDDGSYSPGDQIELPIKEALALIDSDQGVPTNKKEYEKALALIDKAKTEEAEKEAQINAILEKETLALELIDLYRQVARKAAQIEGIVLTDEEVEAFVEKSMNGEDPSDEGKQDGADNTADTKSSSDQVPPKGDGE